MADLVFDSNGLYITQTWFDEVDNYTPITAERLNHIEQGIRGLSESWNSQSHGTVSVHVNGSDLSTTHVDFPQPFKSIPYVTTQVYASNPADWATGARNVTTTGFDVTIKKNTTQEVDMDVHWFAIA